MKRNHIFVVDDDSSLRRVMKMQLEEAGYEVTLANDGDQAWKMLKEMEPQLIITDLQMPTSGLELLGRIVKEGMQTTVIVVTAFGTIETAVEAMRMGAYDYVTKPIDFEALVLIVQRAMERQNLIEEVRTLRTALDERYGFSGIVGHSKGFLRVLDQAARVSQRNTTVLIQGETGTGKEIVARAISCLSIAAQSPGNWSSQSSSAMCVARLPVRWQTRQDASRRRTGAQFFLTRSASFPWRHRSSSCACCRRAKFTSLARTRR
jgi:DNA-binding NtrC family response regulator